MSKRQTAINTAAQSMTLSALTLWRERLDADQFGPAPDHATLWPILAECLTADPAGVNVRRIARARKRATPAGRALLERMEWHIAGRSNLAGPIMGRAMLGDPELWDQLDTFATILGAMTGRKSASTVWRDAMGI